MPCMNCFDGPPGHCSQCGDTIPEQEKVLLAPKGLPTICHCVGCKFHPKHKDLEFVSFPVGWVPEDNLQSEAGCEVSCLKPSEEALSLLTEDAKKNVSFPVTAYGPASVSITGYVDKISGIQILAYCQNETGEGENLG